MRTPGVTLFTQQRSTKPHNDSSSIFPSRPRFVAARKLPLSKSPESIQRNRSNRSRELAVRNPRATEADPRILSCPKQNPSLDDYSPSVPIA
jgi:hypothetical protein